MNYTKRLLINGVTIKSLAERAGMQRSNLSKIINGERRANRDLAINLVRCANELTGHSVFEPSDFNDQLHNLDNVCADVRIRVSCPLFNVTKVVSVGELLEKHDNLNLMLALNNLVYDGETQAWGGYNLDLQPEDQPVRW
jgi:transcriptional regulator with XRE-family HTH domain|tara:strand:+ start:890 stop:1309 length:420 start_codon:yes stop_codon:yes gene_type:complete